MIAQVIQSTQSTDGDRGSGRILLDDAELRALGAADAAFGDRMAYTHPAYVAGYVRELDRRPKDALGQIIYAQQPQPAVAVWPVAADSGEF